MSWLASVILVLTHFVYAIGNALYALFARFARPPGHLRARRRRLPTHLALLLTCDDHVRLGDAEQIFLETILDVAEWCRILGIERLSAYDQRGILQGLQEDIVECFDLHDNSSIPGKHGKFPAYPFTPPESDASGSRPLSPETLLIEAQLSVVTLHPPALPPTGSLHGTSKTTRPLTLHLLSYASSTPAIASVTRAYAASQLQHDTVPKKQSSFGLSVAELNAALEGDKGFPAPDLMIVHDCSPAVRARAPLELHGFPPWQIRLTEIYHDEYPPTQWRWLLPWRRGRTVRLDERKFRRALDEFAGAEMRLGK